MKLLICVLIIVLIMPLSGHSSSLSNAQKKLKEYTSTISKEKRSPNKINERNEALMNVIRDSVKTIIENKETASPEFINLLLKVTVESFKTDPSLAAAELIYPLYKKDKKLIEESMKSLSEEDAKSLLEAFKDIEREEFEGNG